jgi:uncharacterized protein YxeA
MKGKFIFFSLWLTVFFGFFTVGLAQAQLDQPQSLIQQEKQQDQQDEQEKKEDQQKQQQQTANFQSLEQQQQAELSGGGDFFGGDYNDGQGVSNYSHRGSASRRAAHSNGSRKR